MNETLKIESQNIRGLLLTDINSTQTSNNILPVINSTKSYVPNLEEQSISYIKNNDPNTPQGMTKSFSQSTFTRRSRLRNSNFMNNNSTFFNSQKATQDLSKTNTTSHINKGKVMKLKLREDLADTGSKLEDIQSDVSGVNAALSFSRIVFNPKTRFDDSLNKTFFNNSKNQMQKSKLNYKLEPSYNTIYGKVVNRFSENNQKKASDFRIKSLKRTCHEDNTQGRMPRLNNPLSDKFMLTDKLNLMINKVDDEDCNQINKKGEVELDEDFENNYIENMMNQSNDDILSVDLAEKKIVGDDAVFSYNSHYKNLNKVMGQNELLQQTNSVYTNMLNYVEENSLLPQKCGVIKKSGSKFKLGVPNQMLGKKYIGVVAESIKTQTFEKINVKNNSLFENGARQLLTNMKNSTSHLNISKNYIRKSALLLNPILSDTHNRLKILKLDKNNIGDHSVNELLGSLDKNKHLEIISLKENNLTDKCSDRLCKYLLNHPTLREIYLRWNRITSYGGQKIFIGLAKNDSVKVIDFSWNDLGENYKTLRTDNGFIEDLCSFFEQNKTVIHIDLSNNHFSHQEAEKITPALASNKTIYGFHFDGNIKTGYVDSEAHLELNDQEFDDNFTCYLDREISGVKRQKIIRAKNFDSVQDIKNSCWICDGWIALEFKWDEKKDALLGDPFDDESVSQDEEEDKRCKKRSPVFIHFKHENYKPIYMKPDEDGNTIIRLMVPNTRLFFFFTKNQMSMASKDYMSIWLEQPEAVTTTFLDEENMHLVQNLNVFETNICSEEVIDQTSFEPNVHLEPRILRETYFVDKPKVITVIFIFINKNRKILSNISQDGVYLFQYLGNIKWKQMLN